MNYKITIIFPVNEIFWFFLGAISSCTLYPRKKAWDAAAIWAKNT